MAKLKALVCDDEAPLRDLMARRLEKMDLEVERAESGTDAAARLEANRYDLLVTDIYMPDVTGLQLLQQMKALDAHAQVVVVTASATLDNAVQALNHGAFAYLTKPFDHLSVFDNVVSRAVDFRRAVLDNLRMGEVQRRRGDLLEQEIAGRIRQVKRIQEYLIDLLACLPVGVVVLDEEGRVELANPRAEALFGAALVGGDTGWAPVLDSLPASENGQRAGEVELGGRRLEVSLTRLEGDSATEQQVVVAREPDDRGPALGSLVAETLDNLRRGLTWLSSREDGPDAQKIVRGMAHEVSSLASLLGLRSAGAEATAAPRRTNAPPSAPPTSGPEADLAPAVIPPRKPAEPGNGSRQIPNPQAEPPVPAEPLPAASHSLMLRKGMTMVLEGRLRRKRSTADLAARPEEAQRMKEQIERWARSGEGEDPESDADRPGLGGPSAWPPPLPSSAKR